MNETKYKNSIDRSDKSGTGDLASESVAGPVTVSQQRSQVACRWKKAGGESKVGWEGWLGVEVGWKRKLNKVAQNRCTASFGVGEGV